MHVEDADDSFHAADDVLGGNELVEQLGFDGQRRLGCRRFQPVLLDLISQRIAADPQLPGRLGLIASGLFQCADQQQPLLFFTGNLRLRHQNLPSVLPLESVELAFFLPLHARPFAASKKIPAPG